MAGRNAAVCSSSSDFGISILSESQIRSVDRLAPATSPKGLLPGRNVHSARRHQVNVRDLGRNPHIAPSRLLLRPGEKTENVLMFEPMGQVLEIGSKRHRSTGKPDVVRLAAGL